MGSKKTQPVNAVAKKKKDINPQQQMFCRYLLADPSFNGTAAAKKAGYAAPGPRSQKLLDDPAICAYLGSMIRKRQEEPDVSDITQVRVLRELATIGFSNIQQMVDENGRVRPLHSLPEDVARAIASVEVQERTFIGGDGDPVTLVETKVKLWPKNQALESIAKHLGMLNEKLDVKVEAGADMTHLLIDLLAAVEGRNNVVDGVVIEERISQQKKVTHVDS